MENPINPRFSAALKTELVANADSLEMSKKMCTLLNNVSTYCGFRKMEPEDMVVIVNQFVRRAKETFPYFHLDEIEIAFEYGSEGRLGDFYGISMRTLMDWMRRFKDCPERQEARRRQWEEEEQQKRLMANPRLTEIDERLVLERVFGTFVRTGRTVTAMAIETFKQLQKRGILTKTDDEKRAAIEEARRNGAEYPAAEGARMLVEDFFRKLIDSGNSLKLLTAEERIKYGL